MRDVEALNISDRDRAIWAFVEANPGAHPREIHDALDNPYPGLRTRLPTLTMAGYLRRTGQAWASGYVVGRPLPDRAPFAKRSCVDCTGRWEPTKAAAGTRCPTCRRLREALDRAAELGVPDVQLVLRPLESRAQAPHPLQPGELVWVDGPGDIDALAYDLGLTRSEAMAA